MVVRARGTAYAGWRKVGTFPNPTKLQNDRKAGAVPVRLLRDQKARLEG